jgi:hypothetical protein
MYEPKSPLTSQVERIVHLLVQGRFDDVVKLTGGVRLDAAAIHQAISNYGQTLVDPPQSAFQELDVIQVKGSAFPTWSIWMPLWTAREGKSDLSIQLTLIEHGETHIVELDDIHVL